WESPSASPGSDGAGACPWRSAGDSCCGWAPAGCSRARGGTSHPCSRRWRSSGPWASRRATGSSPRGAPPPPAPRPATGRRGERARADQSTRQLKTAREMVLHALTALTETRDFETGAHLVRTSRYALVLGEALSAHPKFRDFLTAETVDLIARLAPIHDIGKVGVADRTPRKPRPLSGDERVET